MAPGRLVNAVDFEQVLRSRARASSPHFALHHVPGRPSSRRFPNRLPTEDDPKLVRSVDNLDSENIDEGLSPPIWLGLVVPKRHARRAVTRSLVKRQIRAALARRMGALAGGLWVVRLRAGFDRASFVSAASPALRLAVRDELETLLAALTTAAERGPDRFSK